MWSEIKNNFKNYDKKTSLVIGICLFMILVISSAYAYFTINATNNSGNTNVEGNLASRGNVTLTTNTSNLYLNLDGVLMNKSNIGKKYYATDDASGTPILDDIKLNNGIYTLATASLDGGSTKYDCTYKYKITATLNTPISDGSDEDIKIKFTGDSITDGSIEYTLKQLVTAGDSGIDFTGAFKNMTAEVDQTITIESTVENTSDTQDDFAGNRYTINIEPYEGAEGFSCEIVYAPPVVNVSLNENILSASITKGDNDLSSYCINQESMSDNCTWNTLTGTEVTEELSATGTYYVHVKDNKDIVSTSEGIYYEVPSFAEDLIASNKLWQSGLEGDGYRYTGTNPENYICFGTTDKTQCTSEPNTYMYRIIGVFPDEQGEQHLKLIKYASLPSTMKWHSSDTVDINWEQSDLYKALNGSTYLNNTTYIPSGWSSKITNWKWSAVNTLSYYGSGGPHYYNSLRPSNIYLHEMNRNSKTSTMGEWTTPSAQIGLMYASDYTLSLGETAKNMTTGTYTNAATLKTGWMNLSNNANPSGSSYEWTVSRLGRLGSDYSRAWNVNSDGYVSYIDVAVPIAARPVFYLTSDTIVKAGSTGTIEDPYIIE